MELESLTRLSCLSHPQRLAMFRLLMRRYPDAVPAGEIVASLGLKPSTGSVYLSALHQAGLAEKTRASTSILYRARTEALQELMGFLTDACCQGRADLCAPLADLPGKRLNVVFLCTGNSARSLMAEAMLRDAGLDGIKAYSAGTEPFRAPNAMAMKLLQKKGHATKDLHCKPLEEVGEALPRVDLVVTVCDRAANQDGPKWPGQPVRAHWGLPDPVAVEGDKKTRKQGFQKTYAALRQKIDALAALNFDAMERQDLQQAVDRIAAMELDG